MKIHDQIAGFFREYLEAFARSDAYALSDFWDVVGLFPSPTGNFAMDRQAFYKHCGALMEFYRQQGVERPEGELVSAVELFPGVVFARMAYRMRGSADNIITNWDHYYILRHTDRWRVSLTIADGEMAAWKAKGVSL